MDHRAALYMWWWYYNQRRLGFFGIKIWAGVVTTLGIWCARKSRSSKITIISWRNVALEFRVSDISQITKAKWLKDWMKKPYWLKHNGDVWLIWNSDTNNTVSGLTLHFVAFNGTYVQHEFSLFQTWILFLLLLLARISVHSRQVFSCLLCATHSEQSQAFISPSLCEIRIDFLK